MGWPDIRRYLSNFRALGGDDSAPMNGPIVDLETRTDHLFGTVFDVADVGTSPVVALEVPWFPGFNNQRRVLRLLVTSAPTPGPAAFGVIEYLAYFSGAPGGAGSHGIDMVHYVQPAATDYASRLTFTASRPNEGSRITVAYDDGSSGEISLRIRWKEEFNFEI